MSIAATITGTDNNGHAVISGVRSYTFNGVVTTVAINGIVDPKFIDAGSVNSNHVSNFAIQITGRKEGLVVRPAPLEEGGTASLQLTEAEKQRIIVDYLEKIVRELTR